MPYVPLENMEAKLQKINFKCNLVNENRFISEFIIKIWSLGYHWWETSIGLDKGLKPQSRETIVEINDDSVQRRIYALVGRWVQTAWIMMSFELVAAGN